MKITEKDIKIAKQVAIDNYWTYASSTFINYAEFDQCRKHSRQLLDEFIKELTPKSPYKKGELIAVKLLDQASFTYRMFEKMSEDGEVLCLSLVDGLSEVSYEFHRKLTDQEKGV